MQHVVESAELSGFFRATMKDLLKNRRQVMERSMVFSSSAGPSSGSATSWKACYPFVLLTVVVLPSLLGTVRRLVRKTTTSAFTPC